MVEQRVKEERECSDWFYAVHFEFDVDEHFADKVNILMMLTTSVCKKPPKRLNRVT